MIALGSQDLHCRSDFRLGRNERIFPGFHLQYEKGSQVVEQRWDKHHHHDVEKGDIEELHDEEGSRPHERWGNDGADATRGNESGRHVGGIAGLLENGPHDGRHRDGGGNPARLRAPQQRCRDEGAAPGTGGSAAHGRQGQVEPETSGARHVHERAVDDEEQHERDTDGDRHPEDPLECHIHVPDDPIDFITTMGKRAREIPPEKGVEQEAQNDQGKGIVHRPPRELEQQQNGDQPKTYVQGVGKGRTPDELVQIDQRVSNAGHAENGQPPVKPGGPGGSRLR